MRSLIRKLIYSLPVNIRILLLKKISLLYYKAGIGDTLMVSAVVREIKKKYGEKIIVTVNCDKNELLKNNPYIDNLSNRYDGIDLNYHYGRSRSTDHFDTNLIDIMCHKVNIKNPEHTVNIFLEENEIEKAKEILKNIKKPLVTIQTTSGPFDAGRKLWPPNYWQELIKRLTDKGYSILQLGSKDDILINGVINMLGKTSIRESAAIISLADLHIGIVSSLMHISEAVSTAAIILFGGFERYKAHDYKNIIPFESFIECSPCGVINTSMDPCPYYNKCMKEISVNTVFERADKLLSSGVINNE